MSPSTTLSLHDPVRHGKYRVSIKFNGQMCTFQVAHLYAIKIYLKHSKACKAYGPGLKDGYARKRKYYV